ncbi:MAG: Wzz/FepE/Etk N-terminal domain-containing protein [Bryobacteraceae bacterium]
MEEPNLSDMIQTVAGGLKRNRWWFIGTACFTALLGMGVVMAIPDKYTSEVMLGVVQQQISQRYVDPASSLAGADALRAIEREILSRARLFEIINAFGLYPKERQSMTPEALVALMRKDVKVEPVEQVTARGELIAFSLSFTARDSKLAQDVTGRLASLFIEENLKSQGAQATNTAKFLTEQLAAAKAKLDEQEQRLRNFKVSNLGELPEQQQGNFAALTDLRIQLQTTMANSSRAQQQRIYLESVINGNLARLQAEKNSLLSRLTPRHPEIIKKDQEVESMRNLANRLKGDTLAPDHLAGAAVLEDPALLPLRGQVEANAADLRQTVADEQRLRAEMARYQGKLRLTPVREQQLASILRDYETFKQDYTDLLGKQLRSQLTANLEEQQGGQHFRLVDPPTLPTKPSSPKRQALGLGAAAAGIAVGLGVALIMSLRDRSFYTERALRLHLGGPPLVVAIPVLLTPDDERRGRWVSALEWIVAMSMLIVVCTAELYIYRHG